VGVFFKKKFGEKQNKRRRKAKFKFCPKNLHEKALEEGYVRES
jgi:hypothetical protein